VRIYKQFLVRNNHQDRPTRSGRVLMVLSRR
jgi:hypothetical protein